MRLPARSSAKGAHFTAAWAFEMASTNLVLELTIIMVALLGWQLTLAEIVGAPLMVVLLPSPSIITAPFLHPTRACARRRDGREPRQN